MSARAPLLVVAAVGVLGAVVASDAVERPRPASDRIEPGLDMPAVPPGDVLGSAWYCAAGTGDEAGPADHTVIVLNPGDDEVTGTVDVYAGDVVGPGAGADDPDADETVTEPLPPADAPAIGRAWPPPETAGVAHARRVVRIPPGGQVGLRLGDVQPGPLVAALVEADGPVAAAHEVLGPTGADVGPCASAASVESHLAWGATTRDARQLVVLFNPFPSPAVVDLGFSTDEGIREPERFQGVPVPAGGVVGLDVGEEVTRRDQVATTIRSRSGPVVAERLQLFDASEGLRGLSLGLAVPDPQEAWAFAHGQVGEGRGEQIVVYNPSEQRAEAEVVVWAPRAERTAADADDPGEEAGDEAPIGDGGATESDGQPLQATEPFAVTVPPGRHSVVDLGDTARVPDAVGHATLVRSRNGVAVVAERVLTHQAGDGAVAGRPGVTLASDQWVFPALGDGEGSTRLVVHNPDPERPARVVASGVGEVQLPPNGRAEVPTPAEAAPAGDGGAATVLRADIPVIAEHVVTTPDGVDRTAGPGIPSADGAVPLSFLGAPDG